MKISLSAKILSGLIIGVLVGLQFREVTIFINTIKPFGELFINICQMVLVPLVFAALVQGVASMGELKKLGRMGVSALSYYLLTTALAITLGLVLANLIEPGLGLTLPAGAKYAGKDAVPLVRVLLDIVPVNPLKALFEGNILQIIVFAVFLGMGIKLVGEKAKPVHQFFASLSEVMYKITEGLMALAPFGIFALIVPVAAGYGYKVLMPLLAVIFSVSLASLLHIAIVYSLAVKILAGMSPWRFFTELVPVILVAFASCSSSAALPISMKTVEERLGVSREVTGFVLPLGAIINMDGTAIYHGVCVVFIAQVFNLELTFSQQLMIIMTSTLASLGTAGVPGAGLIMLTMVLQSVGLPLEGMALIIGLDSILGMFRTTTDVTGNACAAVVVQGCEQAFLAKAKQRATA